MTRQNYTTIFFDWGGVIANDPGDEFLGQLLYSVGATQNQVQQIFETYMQRFMRGKITEAEYWQTLRATYGFVIDDSISDEFKKWHGLVANNDILALAKTAKTKGFNIAVLSNVIEPTYNVIQQAGYYDLFDAVIASCKVGFIKPEKEIYQIALDRFGVTAGESIFVDDKQSMLDTANQLGFTTILAQNPAQIVRDTQACWD